MCTKRCSILVLEVDIFQGLNIVRFWGTAANDVTYFGMLARINQIKQGGALQVINGLKPKGLYINIIGINVHSSVDICNCIP